MQDDMAPDASPGTLGSPGGVRRVNKLPLLLAGSVVVLFVVMVGLVAKDRSDRQQVVTESAKTKAGDSKMFAQAVTGNRVDGIVEPATPPATPGVPGGTLPPVPIVRPENLVRPDNPDTPPRPRRPTETTDAGAPGLDPARRRDMAPASVDDEALRIRMAKLQTLQEAVKARTAVPFLAPRSSGTSSAATPGSASQAGAPTRDDVLSRLASVRQQLDAQRATDPTAAYQARLAQVRSMTSGSSAAAATVTPTALQAATPSGAGQTTYAQFSGGNGGSGSEAADRWKLDARTEPPRSPYELRAGWVVPAILISGINSDLPGQISAQVAQHVYDTPTGTHLLIPQGSRLVGTYSSAVIYGQARVLVAWQRIVFPDGKALDIGAMPGADSAGYSGFQDQVNNHYARLFGSAILLSGVTAGITYSQRDTQAAATGAPTASSALSEALGQQLGQVTTQLLTKNMTISPTLEIRPGYRFNVVVTKDLTFAKPYQPFDY